MKRLLTRISCTAGFYVLDYTEAVVLTLTLGILMFACSTSVLAALSRLAAFSLQVLDMQSS